MPVVELEEDAFDEVMRVNVRGTYLCSRAVALNMIQRDDGGKIIIIPPARENGAGPVLLHTAHPVCPYRLYSVVGPRAWSTPNKRERHLSGLVNTERTDFIAAALTPQGSQRKNTGLWMIRAGETTAPMGRVAQGEDIARTAAF